MPASPSPEPEARKLTYEDYCRIPEDGRRHEILDGVHFVMPSPLTRHQVVSGNLAFALESFLRRTKLGMHLVAPSDVVLDPHNVVQPDHYMVLRTNLGRIGRRGCNGPPDLVVEVLSPGNTAHDLVRKLPIYERAGVVEYWAVNTETERIEVYRREPDPEGGEGATRFARPLVLQAARSDAVETPLLPGFSASLEEIFDPGLAGEAGPDVDPEGEPSS